MTFSTLTFGVPKFPRKREPRLVPIAGADGWQCSPLPAFTTGTIDLTGATWVASNTSYFGFPEDADAFLNYAPTFSGVDIIPDGLSGLYDYFWDDGWRNLPALVSGCVDGVAYTLNVDLEEWVLIGALTTTVEMSGTTSSGRWAAWWVFLDEDGDVVDEARRFLWDGDNPWWVFKLVGNDGDFVDLVGAKYALLVMYPRGGPGEVPQPTSISIDLSIAF